MPPKDTKILRSSTRGSRNVVHGPRDLSYHLQISVLHRPPAGIEVHQGPVRTSEHVDLPGNPRPHNSATGAHPFWTCNSVKPLREITRFRPAPAPVYQSDCKSSCTEDWLHVEDNDNFRTRSARSPPAESIGCDGVLDCCVRNAGGTDVLPAQFRNLR